MMTALNTKEVKTPSIFNIDFLIAHGKLMIDIAVSEALGEAKTDKTEELKFEALELFEVQAYRVGYYGKGRDSLRRFLSNYPEYECIAETFVDDGAFDRDFKYCDHCQHPSCVCDYLEC